MDQIIGRCQIIGEPKYGGMARVYPAIQLSMNRRVALKVMLPHLEQDQEYVARFRREVDIASRLVHNHIVRIYDAETRTPPYWIVMEYLDGGTLRTRLAEGPLPIQEATGIATAMCSALEYAHQQGILHRDVTPSNIMFDRPAGGGQAAKPVLTDLGIARTTEGYSLTGSDKRWGNPFYMSPEQVQGQRLDGRTDIFSLGATLYEMVTGRPPFGRDDYLETMHRIVNDPPVPPSVLNAAAAGLLEAAILKALAKNPAERFQTCGEMEAALVAAHTPQPAPLPMQGPGVVTPPAPLPPQMRPAPPRPCWGEAVTTPARRRKMGLIAVSVALLMLAAVSGVMAHRFHLQATRRVSAPGKVFRPAQVTAQGDREMVVETDAVLSEEGEGVKLARYYLCDRDEQERRGEFGLGWRLQVPYRLDISETTRDMQGVAMPEEVTLVDLLTGKEERFRLGSDDVGDIGYFRPGIGHEQAIYPLTGGLYSLTERKEHRYQFDREGRLALVIPSNDERCGFAYRKDRIASMWGVPLRIDPDQLSPIVVVENIALPQALKLVDASGSHLFTLEQDSLSYFPERAGRWKVIQVIVGGLRLEDAWRNIYDFDQTTGNLSAGIIEGNVSDKDSGSVPAILLTYDERGRVTEAQIGDKGRVTYSYDENGRLASRTDLKGKVVSYGYGENGELLVCDAASHAAAEGGAQPGGGQRLWIVLTVVTPLLVVLSLYLGIKGWVGTRPRFVSG